jgi:uncharacterized protein (TIGR02271 family)
MERDERTDRFTTVEDRFAGYTVYDRDGDKIGKVDDLFLDENDQPEYIGVKMGFFGLSSTLVPMDAVRVDESQQALYVQSEKDEVKNGPRFDDDNEITPEYERQVREYYGLGASSATEERGSYGAYDDRDSDELRVQRSEEELKAGVREREAGQVNVRKRVKTERETVAVPKKREEVTVDRVPVDREAGEAEIGEDEVSVPVVEEEVVVEKRPVVKEEVRVKKDVVQDEEVVEEDVRKEEVDIDDETSGRRS